MHSVRLDPFSAKLLAIRTRGKSGTNHVSDNDDEYAINARAAVSTASRSMDNDSDDDYDDGNDDDDDDDDDDHDDDDDYDGGNVATATSMLPVPDRVVAFTGCDTCDKHADKGLPTMAELMAEITDLKARVQHLEERVTPAG